jgi:hypothetical protein
MVTLSSRTRHSGGPGAKCIMGDQYSAIAQELQLCSVTELLGNNNKSLHGRHPTGAGEYDQGHRETGDNV